jgi:hypothetical protein
MPDESTVVPTGFAADPKNPDAASRARRSGNTNVTLGGVKISQVSSKLVKYAAARIADGADLLGLKNVAGLAGRNARAQTLSTSQLGIQGNGRLGLSALARRPGALRPDFNGDNVPVIQVLNYAGEGGTPSVVGSFYDFILSGVTEADAEKMEVVETFGAPHVFSSGRFARKFQFSGICRAAPQNWTSSSSALNVSQAMLLRKFYDDYLRSTQQAQYGWITQIVVDGDIYLGWVTTLNLAREAANEHVTPFTFSMVGIKRSHVQENDIAVLLQRFKATKKTSLPKSLAQGELDGSIGKTVLQLKSNGSAVTDPSFTAKLVTDSSEFVDLGATLSLVVTNSDAPSGRLLQVKGANPGLSLQAKREGDKDWSSAVGFSLTPGVELLLRVHVDSFAEIRKALSTNTSTTAEGDLSATWDISAIPSNTVKISCSIPSSGDPSFKVSGTWNVSPTPGAAQVLTFESGSSAAVPGTATAEAFFSPTGDFTAVFKLICKTKEGALITDAATLDAVELDRDLSGPAPAAGYVVEGDALDADGREEEAKTHGLEWGSITPVPPTVYANGERRFSLSGKINLGSVAPGESPYLFGNKITIPLQLKMTMPGVSPPRAPALSPPLRASVVFHPTTASAVLVRVSRVWAESQAAGARIRFTVELASSVSSPNTRAIVLRMLQAGPTSLRVGSSTSGFAYSGTLAGGPAIYTGASSSIPFILSPVTLTADSSGISGYADAKADAAAFTGELLAASRSIADLFNAHAFGSLIPPPPFKAPRPFDGTAK